MNKIFILLGFRTAMDGSHELDRDIHAPVRIPLYENVHKKGRDTTFNPDFAIGLYYNSQLLQTQAFA